MSYWSKPPMTPVDHSSDGPFFYRCAGPNCGVLKRAHERWWLMWTSFAEFQHPVLYLCPWDEEVAAREGTLHVCGESCAQKLQSQFMGNILDNQLKRSAISSAASK